MRVVAGSALAAAALYAILAGAGDLKAHLALYLSAHALLLLLMGIVWRSVATANEAAFRVMLIAAVCFRLIAVMTPPSLSDDVYRYVWDGRAQAAGHHPYKYAPADPMRQDLRDTTVYPKINHPEIPTIYPPLAELLFAALAFLQSEVTGFKLAAAALDAGVVWALLALLAAEGWPRDRVVLYAWNPLAVIESGGSGHIEPLGVLFVVMAVAWITRGETIKAGAALGAAIQAKLFPLILVFGFVRRIKLASVAAMLAVVAIIAAPYALRGPWTPAGIQDYALRWEHGAVLFAGVQELFERHDPSPTVKAAIAWVQLPALYRWAWPGGLARWTVAGAAVAWAVFQSFRPGSSATREVRLAMGGALLLSPTLHPWYVLWLLPLAAAEAAGGWLLLGALVPLQYLAGEGEVPWWIRLTIVVPALVWMARDSLLRSRR